MKKIIHSLCKVTTVLMTFGIAHLSTAQDLQLAGVQYINYPKVNLKDDADDFDIRFQEFGGFFAIPKVLKNDNFILTNGLSYGFVKSTLQNPQQDLEASNIYHRISYSFSTIYRGVDDWVFIARISPTLASDLDQALSKEDFMMFGALMGTKSLNERVKLGGGLVYTSRLGSPLLLPLFQYSYKAERHSFNTFLPAVIQYNYAFGKNEKLKAGFKIAPNGSNFNANQDQFSQVTVDKLNYVRINMGPEVSYMVTDMLKLEVSGGLSARRMYTFYDEEDTSYEYNSKNGAYLTVGLFIVPPMNKKK